MPYLRRIAASAICAGSLLGQPPSPPSIEITCPGLNPNRYVFLTPDSISTRRLAINDRGTQREMVGFPLAKFLTSAGWGNPDDVSSYVVKIEGDGIVVLTLSEILRRAIDNRVWLVTERFGEPNSQAERPLIAVVDSDGVGDVRVRDIRRMLVIPAGSRDLEQHRDFTRLAAYTRVEGSRILWDEYIRLDLVSMMVGTWSVNGSPDKAAILLSEQIAGWSDERVLKFLAMRAGLRIRPEAVVERGADYTVVRLRLAFALRAL